MFTTLVAIRKKPYHLGIVKFRGRSSERTEGEDSIVKRTLGQTLGSVVLFLFEVIQIAIFAIAAIVVIRVFIIKPFIVEGGSMEPNYFDGEYLIVDELSYRFRDASRGEVVVFHPPNQAREQFYIKRVIGLPGETIEIVDGEIWVYNDEYPNGIRIRESYIDEFTDGQLRTTIGLDEYFLMGDNRDSSLDSRKFGPVPMGNVVGRALLRGLPLHRFGPIAKPLYTY